MKSSYFQLSNHTNEISIKIQIKVALTCVQPWQQWQQPWTSSQDIDYSSSSSSLALYGNDLCLPLSLSQAPSPASVPAPWPGAWTHSRCRSAAPGCVSAPLAVPAGCRPVEGPRWGGRRRPGGTSSRCVGWPGWCWVVTSGIQAPAWLSRPAGLCRGHHLRGLLISIWGHHKKKRHSLLLVQKYPFCTSILALMYAKSYE